MNDMFSFQTFAVSVAKAAKMIQEYLGTSMTADELLEAIKTAGTTQKNEVNNAGSTQIQAIEDKGVLVLANIPDDYESIITSINLHNDEIDGTTQTIEFAEDGSLKKIVHKRGNTIIRTDTFTFTDSTVTELRVLSTGDTLTIVTNLNTLETTITKA